MIRGAQAETFKSAIAPINADTTSQVFVPTFPFPYNNVTSVCHKLAITFNSYSNLQLFAEWRFLASRVCDDDDCVLESPKDHPFTKTLFVDRRSRSLETGQFPTFDRLLYSPKIKYKVGR